MDEEISVVRAYKTELDPNNKQSGLFRQYAGTSRFVFNWALADRKQRYNELRESTSEGEQRKRFNAIKEEEFPWILDTPYAITEAAFGNCNIAFRDFFRRVKNGEKPGYPKFKRKHGRASFQLRNTRVRVDRVRLTKVGWVRLKERAYIPHGDGVSYCVYATVSERAGRWYISIPVKRKIEIPPSNSTLVIGIDLGIKAVATLSNGKTFENPKYLYRAERKVRKLNKELARRTKGGKNWKKTRRKLACAYAKMTNCRRHFQHQISHYVTAELQPRVIVLENLNVRGMMSNGHLSKAVSDVGFYELRRQIEYKAEQRGIKVVIADRWYASSKTCSECGWYDKNLKLSDRLFVCGDCGKKIDRDLNAAINLSLLAKE